MDHKNYHRIFLSAVSDELLSCRKKLAQVLRRKGIEVRDQEHFRQSGFSLLESIDSYIDECDAVICLVGSYCGHIPSAEHMAVIDDNEWVDRFRLASGQANISYSQWEFIFAKSKGKPTYVYITANDFVPDKEIIESDLQINLQEIYRNWIRQLEIQFDSLISADQLAIDVLVQPLNCESFNSYEQRLIKNRDAIVDKIIDKFKAFVKKGLSIIHENSEEIRMLKNQLDAANEKLSKIEDSYSKRNEMIAELKKSNPDEMLQKAISCLAVNPEVGTKELEKISMSHSALAIDAQLIMANNYFDLLLFEEAMRCCEKSIRIDPSSKAAYEFGAYMANCLGMLDKSRDYLLKQKELTDDPYSLSNISNNLGILEKNQKSYEQALTYFEEAIDLINRSDNDDDSKNLRIEFNVAGIYGDLKRFDMAKDLYEYLLSKFEVDGMSYGLSLIGLSSCYYALNKYSVGEKYAKKAYEVIRKNGFENSHGCLEVVEVMINNHNLTGKISASLELNLKFENDTREYFANTNSIHFPHYLGEIAKNYEKLRSYRNAERVYIDLIGELEKHTKQYSVFMANAYAAIGLLYRKQRKTQKAKKYFIRALSIRRRTEEGTSMLVATTQNNLAGVYCDLKRYHDAEKLYLESLAIREFNHGSKDKSVVSVCSNIAGMYLSMNRPEKAYEYCRKACDIATGIFTHRDLILVAVHTQLHEIQSKLKK